MLKPIDMRAMKFLTGCPEPSELAFEPEKVGAFPFPSLGVPEFRNSPLCMFFLPGIDATRPAAQEFQSPIPAYADASGHYCYTLLDGRARRLSRGDFAAQLAHVENVVSRTHRGALLSIRGILHVVVGHFLRLSI